MVLLAASITGQGEARPFVPVRSSYLCARCKGERHEGETVALADSGATRAVMPASALPDHVLWKDLPPAAIVGRHGLNPNPIETRIWHADFEVFGVLIAREMLVSENDEPGTMVLGLGDLFRHFYISFAWSNVPPVFALEPIGQLAPPAFLRNALIWSARTGSVLAAPSSIYMPHSPAPRALPATTGSARTRTPAEPLQLPSATPTGSVAATPAPARVARPGRLTSPGHRRIVAGLDRS